jgi:hypothetical protein
MNKIHIKFLLWSLGFLALGVGLCLRFWNITTNQFLFYDEGMYLGYNHHFLQLVAANSPKDFHELSIILGMMVKASLGTAKALWFFLLNLRVFVTGPDGFYFARVVSAVSGVATIGLTYLFAHRYFQSKKIAFLSAVFLSLLPSHVFYSRLGMQESFSTLLFLGGLYMYVFYKAKNWGPSVAALLFACVFLTNYRMIISPVFFIAIELFEAFKNKETFNWKRPLIGLFTFAIIVFVVGSLYDGINRYVTFGWMSHQAKEAQGQGSLINIFSYPYYVFALEGILFGLLFWSNLYLTIQKQWSRLLPFFLVLLQMGIFSLAAERGARYICVVLPLIAVSTAVVVDYLLSVSPKKIYVMGFVFLACVGMGVQSIKIVDSNTHYAKAVQLVLTHDPKARIVSTQATVEGLYVNDENAVKECPKSLGEFIALYREGYRYLILDPQIYISWTKDGQRFSPPLIDFLQFIEDQVPPLMVYEHLKRPLLRRFVLDHNQNLWKSVTFLNGAYRQGYGQIRVYDMGQCLMQLKQQAASSPKAP